MPKKKPVKKPANATKKTATKKKPAAKPPAAKGRPKPSARPKTARQSGRPLIPEALRKAVLDDPDDDFPRLVVADWLEEHGDAARAEWIRVSIERARHFRVWDFDDPQSDARMDELLDRETDAFERCKPAYWKSISNVDEEDDRGMKRLTTATRGSNRGFAPVERLGEVDWLGRAYDEMWLRRIDVCYASQGLVEAIARWKGAAARIPLMIRTGGGDEILRRIYRLPQLEALQFEPSALGDPMALKFADSPRLWDVMFKLEDRHVDAVLKAIVAAPNLRRLHFQGHDHESHATRPNDADLWKLRGMTGLRRLFLTDAPKVTDRGIAKLQQAIPGLQVGRLTDFGEWG